MKSLLHSWAQHFSFLERVGQDRVRGHHLTAELNMGGGGGWGGGQVVRFNKWGEGCCPLLADPTSAGGAHASSF